MQFKSNTKDIITKAYSVRWMVAAFIFTVLEVAMPYLQGWLPVPDQLFGVFAGVCTAGAFIARLVVQTDIAG